MIDWKAAGYKVKVLFTANIKIGKEAFALEDSVHFATQESALVFINKLAAKRGKYKKFSNFRIVTL